MQKSRKDRVRRPGGQECAAGHPGAGRAAAAQRSTARAAFEGASPHLSPGSHSGRPPSPAAPGSTMARDVEALDLPAWSRASGLSQGPPVQVSTLGEIAGGPPSCGRRGRSTATLPGLLSLHLLALAPLLRGLGGRLVRKKCSRTPSWRRSLTRSSLELGDQARWGLAVGRDACHALLSPRRTPTSLVTRHAGAALGATPRLRVPALRPGSSRAPGSWWKNKREGLKGGAP